MAASALQTVGGPLIEDGCTQLYRAWGRGHCIVLHFRSRSNNLRRGHPLVKVQCLLWLSVPSCSIVHAKPLRPFMKRR